MQHQRLEQIGPAQEGAVIGCGATDNDVIAAACAGVATIDHELVSTQTGLAGLFIDRGGSGDAVVPT